MNIYLFMHPCVYVHVRFSKSTTAHLDAFRKEFVRCPKIRGDANGVRKEDLVHVCAFCSDTTTTGMSALIDIPATNQPSCQPMNE